MGLHSPQATIFASWCCCCSYSCGGENQIQRQIQIQIQIQIQAWMGLQLPQATIFASCWCCCCSSCGGENQIQIHVKAWMGLHTLLLLLLLLLLLRKPNTSYIWQKFQSYIVCKIFQKSVNMLVKHWAVHYAVHYYHSWRAREWNWGDCKFKEFTWRQEVPLQL